MPEAADAAGPARGAGGALCAGRVLLVVELYCWGLFIILQPIDSPLLSEQSSYQPAFLEEESKTK